MAQLKIINEILADEFFVNSNTLEEKNTDNFGKEFLMKRDIKSHNGIKYSLFRLDPNQTKPFPYFKQEIGLSKICDYIMFVQKNNSLFIILIELKLGSESATKQLLSSEEFAKFVIKSGERIGFKFTEDLYFRKVKISEAALGKPKTAKEICFKDENGIIHYNHKSEFQIMEILHIE
ncbi:hypothetical protein [Flavobacterium psychrophilum]|uniref:Uncharacterized protein n=1 Tax=Flavobacterium psychrophilum TaxID=96345 RepID=A0A8G2G0I4_FLAPS|nr:hypothetical protein [Flavobacterium psychrophilum]EKT3957353.1 hypothetical protein [Flavobacterium psychrophilum]EKT3965990.1 hypothetical protein [Flavobacterium psychrophilum]EKT4510364.1 hypothetical protein [Flavobacterium psychrophilum]EKT4551911.1 hypothetical protein [Flavobacterium psychrophilum]ELM3644222.1 hypothetical protein [Flavobacterium psychrophilum]